MIQYYLIRVLPITALTSLMVYLPDFFIDKRKHGNRPLIRQLAIYGGTSTGK